MSALSPDIDPAISIEPGRSGNPDQMRDIGYSVPEGVVADEAIEPSGETLEQELGRIVRMMEELNPKKVVETPDEPDELSDEEFDRAQRRQMTPAMIRIRDQRK